MTSAPKIPYFTLDADFQYTVERLSTAVGNIESFFDAVAEHLGELGAEDISIILDERTQEFSVSLLVASQEYESIETVVGKGMGMVRTALHVCNARTPGWPSDHDALLRGVRVSPAIVVGGVSPEESRMLSSV